MTLIPLSTAAPPLPAGRDDSAPLPGSALPPRSALISGTALSPAQARLFAKAQALEAAFLTEMLGHAGASAASGPFSGGVGEDQFASFLREQQAGLMVSRGGIGLAEQLFRAMGGESHAS